MKISLLALLFLLGLPATSAIDPYYRDAIERGYRLKGDSVLFPDGSLCLYEDFLKNTCGQKWKTSDYCVKEGKPVWDTTRCCTGLVPYIMPGSDGQSTCEKLPGHQLKSRLKWIWWFFPGMLLVAGLFALRNAYNKRKNKAG
ncbi:MAG: hypothetical protein ACHQF2_07050 [Flavobacteriales bacterium]